jgi:hypothetical protein
VGQFFGVGVPGGPGGGVLVEEDDGVPGGNFAGVIAGGDGVEAVGADELGMQAALLQVVDAQPAHREVQAAVGDPGGLGVRGPNLGVDVDLSRCGGAGD